MPHRPRAAALPPLHSSHPPLSSSPSLSAAHLCAASLGLCRCAVQAGLRPKKEGSRKQRRELKNRRNKVRGKAKAKVGAAGGAKKGKD